MYNIAGSTSNVSDVAREIASAAAFVILAIIAIVRGIPRVLEGLGIRHKSLDAKPDSDALQVLNSLNTTLELSVRTIRDFGKRFDTIAKSMDDLTYTQGNWQRQLLTRIDRIEGLITGSKT